MHDYHYSTVYTGLGMNDTLLVSRDGPVHEWKLHVRCTKMPEAE